jgi:kynureninase
MSTSIDTIAALPRKHLFEIPNDVIYLDGNSLGPLPKNIASRAQTVINDERGKQLIRGLERCQMDGTALRVGNQIVTLIGAPEGSVIMCDSLSIKVYQAL